MRIEDAELGQTVLIEKVQDYVDEPQRSQLLRSRAVIVNIKPGCVETSLGVSVYGFSTGHSAGGIVKDNSGWFFPPDMLTLIADGPIPSLPESSLLFPTDSAARKNIPVASGVLDYFPAALVEIAKVSYAGNQQHNPGQPLHWARSKSTDQADTIIRHFLERGTFDSDGIRHSAKLAWRALALLQLELEEAGAPKARGAK